MELECRTGRSTVLIGSDSNWQQLICYGCWALGIASLTNVVQLRIDLGSTWGRVVEKFSSGSRRLINGPLRTLLSGLHSSHIRAIGNGGRPEVPAEAYTARISHSEPTQPSQAHGPPS